MRTLVLVAVTAAALVTSLPVWACGMPPRDELVLADAMAEIDRALLAPKPVPLEAAPLTPTPPLAVPLDAVAPPPAPPAPPTAAAPSPEPQT